jgi:hypothetical protein
VSDGRARLARDVPEGASWAFLDQRSQAEPIPRTNAAPPARQDPEVDAIAKFLAARGATHVMSPEQAALFLRRRGVRAVVREMAPRAYDGVPAYIERQYLIDGSPISIEAFFAIVNRHREAKLLPPVSPPPGKRAASAAW